MAARGMGGGFARRGGACAALSLFASLGLVACAEQEPAAQEPAVQQEPVVVTAVTDSADQELLQEIYTQAFGRVGRAAEKGALVADDERITAVRNGQATVAFGCTGELLGLLDPQRAEQLSDEYVADDDPGKQYSAQWRDEVYVAMSESLPGELMATDPSNAQACTEVSGDNPGAELPQYLVPLYRIPALDRHERVEVLNRVAGSITTAEIAEMLERVEEGESAGEVAGDWIATSRFS